MPCSREGTHWPSGRRSSSHAPGATCRHWLPRANGSGGQLTQALTNPIVTLTLQALANQRLAAQAAARRTSFSRQEAERARVAEDDAQVDAKREWAGKLAQRASFERAAVQEAREAAEVRICIWSAYTMHIRGGTHHSGCVRAAERGPPTHPPLPMRPGIVCLPSHTFTLIFVPSLTSASLLALARSARGKRRVRRHPRRQRPRPRRRLWRSLSIANALHKGTHPPTHLARPPARPPPQEAQGAPAHPRAQLSSPRPQKQGGPPRSASSVCTVHVQCT